MQIVIKIPNSLGLTTLLNMISDGKDNVVTDIMKAIKVPTGTPFENWNGNSFFDKFYKVQNFFPYAIPIVLDNEPPRM